MAKQKGKRSEDRETQARRKLEQAREKLQAAQDEYGRIVAEGEQAVRRARERWDARAFKAKRRVERRHSKLSDAESRLLDLTTAIHPPEAAADTVERLAGETLDQEAAMMSAREDADVGEASNMPTDALEVLEPQIIVARDRAVEVAPPGSDGSRPLPWSAERALQVLRQAFSPQGATSAEWQAACQMPERTFMRARRALLDRGLVTRDGTARGAHYVVSAAGMV